MNQNKPIKVVEKNTVETGECRLKKLQYKVDDPNGVIEDFERFVREDYGFTRGIIGRKVIESLSYFMGLHKFEQYKHLDPYVITESAGTHTKPMMTNHEILVGLLQSKYYPKDRIHFEEIQEIITTDLNKIDKRTHKSYVDVLECNHVLIRRNEVERYTNYYFKEIPESESYKDIVEETLSALDPSMSMVYDEIKSSDKHVSIPKLLKQTKLKEQTLIFSIRKLKEKNLIQDSTAVGYYKLTDSLGAAYEP